MPLKPEHKRRLFIAADLLCLIAAIGAIAMLVDCAAQAFYLSASL